MKKHMQLFLLCWIAYFSTYIGRQNYAAVMAEIIASEGFLNRTCGLVGTAFFISYGVGQIISGVLGDKLNPKWMIFIGVFVSSLSNLAMGFMGSAESMVIVWCVNGAAQSLTWSPLLRIFSEYLPSESQHRAFINIATTYPAAVLLTYPLSSVFVYYLGWRSVFFLSGGFMLGVSCLWLVGFRRLEVIYANYTNKAAPTGIQTIPRQQNLPFRFSKSLILLLILVGFLLAFQGALRDGVTSWVPSYLTNTYQVGTSMAIFATTILPFINLFGVYLANFIYRKLRKNEVETAGILFALAFFSVLCLIFVEGFSLFLSLLFFATTTSCMMGVNVMLVSFIPSYFIPYGKVSTISGILNSTVYMGSSMAAYGLGAVADLAGWSFILKVLCVVAGVGVLGSLVCIPRWKEFLVEHGR